MSVINIHERVLDAPVAEADELIDRLASTREVLWPRNRWPAMKFNRPLSVGARGGHGPIRYFVESYEPGRSIQFQFTGPKGFLGHHRFEIEEFTSDKIRLRHIGT